MSFGDLPPQFQPRPAPPGGGSAGGNFARAMGNARRRVRGREQYAAQRSAYVAAATERLRAIGSTEAQQIADILAENPEGVNAFVANYGGWTALEDGLRSSAAQSAATNFAGSLPPDSPERAHAEFQAHMRQPNFDPALTANSRSQDRQQRAALQDDQQDFAARENALDRGSRERVAGQRISAAQQKAAQPTPSQARVNAQTDHARQTVRKLQAKNDWGPEDMRRIAAKAKQTGWAQIALALQSNGEGMSDEDYAAALWAAGSSVKYHENPESHQEFMDLAERDLRPAADVTRERTNAAAMQEAEEFILETESDY